MLSRDAFANSRHDDDVDLILHELGDEMIDPLGMTGGKTSFQNDVVAIDITQIAAMTGVLLAAMISGTAV